MLVGSMLENECSQRGSLKVEAYESGTQHRDSTEEVDTWREQRPSDMEKTNKETEKFSRQCRNDPGRQEEPADSYHSRCWRERRRWGMRRRRNDRGKEKSRTRKKERDVIVDNVVGEGGCARCGAGGVVLVEWWKLVGRCPLPTGEFIRSGSNSKS